jgi:hypothetical protein
MNRGDFLWLLVLCVVSSVMIVPSSHEVFVSITRSYPYVMGFVKFAILASMGELLALRIICGTWKNPPGMIYRAIIWGLIGVLVVLMFVVYSVGCAGAVSKGLLWGGSSTISNISGSFWVALIMNLSFAPVFMTAHRITDTYLDLSFGEGIPLSKIRLSDVIAKIDWQGLISFVCMKTIPFFWIPAHTITFLLPPEYRVLMAAYLSIALGAILAYGKKGKEVKTVVSSGCCRADI